ncbi:MAG: methyltransferase domain-containing protein [Campylobacterales bacterium]|nr:methyltransferase domain-containing protein [Campylobacterales bacterium]
MEQFFDNNDTATALEAQYNAQKIAFAPIVFQVARSMRDLGVLQALYEHKEGLDLGALQEKTSLSAYGLLTLLETSLSADIVKQTKERYFLTKTGYFLLKDPMTIANMDYNHHVNYKGLFHLDEAIQTRKPEGLKEFGSWETIYPALSSLPKKAKESWFAFDHLYSDSAFPKAIQHLLTLNPKRVLDVGGNTGKFSISLTQENPALHVSILDLPEQLALAKEQIAARGLQERISLVAGNVLDPDFAFPKGYDVLWMSQFLDCFSEEQIVEILSKAKHSMDKTATLCVMEPFWDRQRFEASAFCIINTSPYFTAMANGYSKMYHSEDFLRLVRKAGLDVVEILDHVGICQTILMLRA